MNFFTMIAISPTCSTSLSHRSFNAENICLFVCLNRTCSYFFTENNRALLRTGELCAHVFTEGGKAICQWNVWGRILAGWEGKNPCTAFWVIPKNTLKWRVGGVAHGYRHIQVRGKICEKNYAHLLGKADVSQPCLLTGNATFPVWFREMSGKSAAVHSGEKPVSPCWHQDQFSALLIHLFRVFLAYFSPFKVTNY